MHKKNLIMCKLLSDIQYAFFFGFTIGIKNEILCKFYGFLSTHVLYSTFLITIIAFDRYFCICWPLYKIITVHRARAIVIICGLLSSLLGISRFLFQSESKFLNTFAVLAIIPMTEFSTFDHILSIHQNHSEELSIRIVNNTLIDSYKHVEHIKSTDVISKLAIGPAIPVTCGQIFSIGR